MKILCHAGPWSDKYLEFISKTMFPGASVVVLSGHRKVDKSGLCDKYYDFVKSKAVLLSADFKQNNSEIIARCRLLRAIPLEEATLHLEAMRKAIAEALDTLQPNFILTETIDAYLMDLLEEQAKHRSIPFVGLVTSFINGYFRISSKGELNISRRPSQPEIEKVLKMLTQRDYRPNFVKDSIKKHKRDIIVKWARNLIKIPYFLLKRKFFNPDEKYNYHYWASELVSRDWAHPLPRLSLGNKNWKNELGKGNHKKIIYVPLQMFPEATIDYWCEDLDFIKYEESLIAFMNKHSGFHFLVKEHPNVQGYRNPKFYDHLAELANVTICPTLASPEEIKRVISAALVWTGTLGFELALDSFPVLTVCKPYYLYGNNFKVISKTTTTEDLNLFISSERNQTHEERYAMVENVLSGNLVGKLRVDGTWELTNADHRNEAIVLANSVKQALDDNIFGSLT